jgi:uncharacterized protein (DUF1697 family)
MATLVALLRGINVGRNKRIAMADLRALMASDLGYAGVRTHLQSGNAIIAADAAPDAVARAIEKGIAQRFGFDVDVVVRTVDELADVVDANPLADVAGDPAKHVVVFLSAKPEAAALRGISAEEFAPERFVARGREIHVWCPGGIYDSRVLKALNERAGAGTGTMRNWRTVTKLLDMARAAG